MSLNSQTSSREAYDSRKILRFFWPLALSWIFMSVEGPTCVAFISRLPNGLLQVAAFNLLMSLALFIESPVIDLLSTSTTLADSRANYLIIRRFVIGLMGLQTLIHAAFVLTPMFHWVSVDLMRVPVEIAEAARTGLIWMIPWSACIGWRRFHQGILIRFGQTKPIGVGTFVRMTTLFVVSIALFVTKALPGATVAGIALICSVFSEAVYASLIARSVIRDRLGDDSTVGSPLSMLSLCRFHFPLTGTTMVLFMGGPLFSWALAQSSDPKLSMGAWQVANSLLWLTRAAAYALPEVVITVGRAGELAAQAMRKFCLIVGAISSAVVLAVSLTGLDAWTFRHVLAADPATIELSTRAFLIGAPLPLIAAIQSYLRGRLTLGRLTSSRLAAIVVGVGILLLALIIGIRSPLEGVVAASYATIAAQLAELAVLYFFWARFASKSMEPKP